MVTAATIGALAGFLVGTRRSDAFWREQVAWYKKSYDIAMSGWGNALKMARESLTAGAGYRDAYHALLMKTYGTAWTAVVKRDSESKTDD